LFHHVVEGHEDCKNLALVITATDVASRLDFGRYEFSFYPIR